MVRFLLLSQQGSYRKGDEIMGASQPQKTDYAALVTLLPPDSVLRMDDVSWQEYEQILEQLNDGYAARVYYDKGKVEIMAPAYMHEKPKNLLHTLVTEIRDFLDIDIESIGSTTLKREIEGQGAEPDDGFYIQNAAKIIGKDDIDLKNDPPPDLIIESDRTSSSLKRLPIYAGLGVPEIWRVIKKRVRIYLLEGVAYKESTKSRAFPFLSAKTLSEFLTLGLAKGERSAAKAFRAWLRENAS
jgi:Uma2 family endonuclease